MRSSPHFFAKLIFTIVSQRHMLTFGWRPKAVAYAPLSFQALARRNGFMITKRVIHQAQDRLDSSSHLFLRHIACRADGDTLYLEGKVPSFYLKQTAQSLIQSLDGVERVDNRLLVVNPYGVSSEPAETT